MKIIFFGLLGLGSTSLKAALDSNFDIAAVVTEPAENSAILSSKLKIADNILKPSIVDFIKYNTIIDTCKKKKFLISRLLNQMN